MTDYRLPKTQRNEVFRMAEELDLIPVDFAWEEKKTSGNSWGDLIHRLEHRPTGAFLEIDHFDSYSGSGYHLRYWPQNLDEMDGARDWEGLRRRIRKWLRVVKSESDAPDLWAIAQQERAWLMSEPADRANQPFTPTQIELLARHLRTIEEYAIKTYQLEESHQAHVRQQLQYLTEAAARVGRLDWKNLATSTFINIVLTLGLDPEKTQKLLALATQLLGPIVLGAARLLSP
jgi:hypothetical protein